MFPSESPTPIRRRFGRAALTLAAVGAIGAVTLATGAATSASAQAAPTLTVSPATLPADRASTVIVQGRNYLVPPHAPGANVTGGVYVLFGWVAPGIAWGPSARNAIDSNGQFGITYSYPGEAGTGETRDDGSGTNRFVSFTTGGVSGSSTPFHMDDAGNWSTSLTILGPVYEWFDPATGQRATVDCRIVQCGVYTFGAHGRASSTNERFAPVTFAQTAVPTTASPTTVPTSIAPSGPGAIPTAPTTAPRATGPRSAAVAGATTSVVPAPSTTAAPVTSTTLLDLTSTTTTTTEPPPGSDDRRRAAAPAGGRAEVVEIHDEGGGPTGWLVVGGGSALSVGALSWWAVRRRSS